MHLINKYREGVEHLPVSRQKMALGLKCKQLLNQKTGSVWTKEEALLIEPYSLC